MTTSSIWKDTYYTTSTSPLNYYITVDGQEIFRGCAVMKPDADNVKINVSRICENYLSSEISNFTASTQTHPNALRTFTLKSTGGTTLETYKFLNCWDRNINYTGGSMTLSMNVGPRVNNMLLLNTTTNGTNVTTTKSIVSNGECGNYALYYLNRAGGWCSFGITGKVIKKDNYERYSIDQAYNNTTIEYQKRPYRNNIDTTLEMHTGWLGDAESEYIARNLFSTNFLYVHDICNDKIAPAFITDTQVEYKTYKNGKRLVNYTINVQLSQTETIL